jgi:hypothetical protein
MLANVANSPESGYLKSLNNARIIMPMGARRAARKMLFSIRPTSSSARRVNVGTTF